MGKKDPRFPGGTTHGVKALRLRAAPQGIILKNREGDKKKRNS